jgi:uncharacterized SAM-dependent methyltransferase
MAIFFKNHQITIMRPHNKGGIKYAYSATYTAYNADIQPQQAERVLQMGGRIGKVYDAFIDATVDIKEGDKIKTEDGKQYSVKAVSKFSGAGLLDHIQLIIEAQD